MVAAASGQWLAILPGLSHALDNRYVDGRRLRDAPANSGNGDVAGDWRGARTIAAPAVAASAAAGHRSEHNGDQQQCKQDLFRNARPPQTRALPSAARSRCP